MTIEREEPLAPAMHLTVMRGGHMQPEVALDVSRSRWRQPRVSRELLGTGFVLGMVSW
jgi:hypothetical protein